MNTISTNEIAQAFQISTEFAAVIRMLLEGNLEPYPFLDTFDKGIYKYINDSGQEHIEMVLRAIDNLVNTSGVEVIDLSTGEEDLQIHYCNVGETYETTVGYDTYEGEFFVGSYGDKVEHYAAIRDVYEDNQFSLKQVEAIFQYNEDKQLDSELDWQTLIENLYDEDKITKSQYDRWYYYR